MGSKLEIIFSTSNPNKAKEAKHILGDKYSILTAKQIGFNDEIEEPFDTFKQNATQKTKTLVDYTNKEKIVFSEDTGLEIYSLDMLPGVKSARFASDPPDWIKNVDKVLQLMKGKQNRKARFITICCLYIQNQYHFFEGITMGNITNHMKGENGFGYDSIFIPEAENFTFAEMTLAKKTKFSHRQKALKKMKKSIEK